MNTGHRIAVTQKQIFMYPLFCDAISGRTCALTFIFAKKSSDGNKDNR